MTAKFKLKTAKDGQYYFVLKAKNGQTLVTSEMYKKRSSALKGIASVKKNAPDAEIVEVK